MIVGAEETEPGWPMGTRPGRSPAPGQSEGEARGPSAGGLQVVLSELHAGNTLVFATLVSQHPCPAELQRALDEDHRGRPPLILPQMPKGGRTQRMNLGLLPRGSRWWELADDAPGHPAAPVLPAAGLSVSASARGLVVHDGRDELFPAIELFGVQLTFDCSRILRTLLPERDHLPRVTLDSLVIQRESWSCDPAELGFASLPSGEQRFLALRRWARRLGLPRFTFYRVPAERKPCYLDLDSPVYCEIFARYARRAGRAGATQGPVSLTEMLPRMDQAWLADGAGERYACELRVAALRGDPE